MLDHAMLDDKNLARLSRVFENVTGKTGVVADPSLSIDKDLKVSSLTKIQLICAIEDEFDIEIPNKVLKKLKNVGDLLDYLGKSI